MSSGVPAVSVPRVRPAPDKVHACFGAEGHWRDSAERPVGKLTFLLLLPTTRSCSSVTPAEDGNSPAGDARQWPRNNIDGKEMAHGGYAHSADFEPPAKSKLHHKTSELQKKNKQNPPKNQKKTKEFFKNRGRSYIAHFSHIECCFFLLVALLNYYNAPVDSPVITTSWATSFFLFFFPYYFEVL